jgi:hypothetical protein
VRFRKLQASSRRTSAARSAIPLAAALLAPLGLVLGAAHAGDLKARIVGQESLRPQALASAVASNPHAFTWRLFDRLVAEKYTALSADPEKDVTIAVYGEGPHKFGLEARVRLAGGRATPATIVIPAGVPVTFVNDDPFLHTLVSGDLKRDLKPGETHKITPKGKGLLTFTDTQAPGVKAFVVIDDGVLMNVAPGRDGSVKIPEALPGSYVLKAYFEGNAKTSSPTLEVKAAGLEVKDPLVVGTPPASSSAAPK